MNSTSWLHYFRKNRLDRSEPQWALAVPGDITANRELARSLSHFQLGESGEGKFLIQQARRLYAGDSDYCEALMLFIQEEQEHARLLRRLVERYQGRLVTRHWTHSLFCVVRRALGARFEIQVLVTAELVGTAYYRLLGRRSVDPVVRQVCELVLRDEARHVAFHAERFATDHAEWLPLERGAWGTQFQTVFLAALQVAWMDHGSALRSLGVTLSEFRREARRECVQFLAAVTAEAWCGALLTPPA